MKIIKNTSAFDTKKLISLYSLIHNQIAKSEGRLKYWKTLEVQVWTKSSGYSGRAYLDKYYGVGWDMHLSMSDNLGLESISQLFAHELMHSYGYNHHQFRTHPLDEEQLDEIRGRFTTEDIKKVETVKLPINRVAKNYKQLKLRKANLEKKQKQYESNLKRIANSTKKVEQSIRQYENKYDQDRLTRKYDEARPPAVKKDWEAMAWDLAERYEMIKIDYCPYDKEIDLWYRGERPDEWDYDKSGEYPCARRYTWKQIHDLAVLTLQEDGEWND